MVCYFVDGAPTRRVNSSIQRVCSSNNAVTSSDGIFFVQLSLNGFKLPAILIRRLLRVRFTVYVATYSRSTNQLLHLINAVFSRFINDFSGTFVLLIGLILAPSDLNRWSKHTRLDSYNSIDIGFATYWC